MPKKRAQIASAAIMVTPPLRRGSHRSHIRRECVIAWAATITRRTVMTRSFMAPPLGVFVAAMAGPGLKEMLSRTTAARSASGRSAASRVRSADVRDLAALILAAGVALAAIALAVGVAVHGTSMRVSDATRLGTVLGTAVSGLATFLGFRASSSGEPRQ